LSVSSPSAASACRRMRTGMAARRGGRAHAESESSVKASRGAGDQAGRPGM
jgi:hypothetical protein